MNTGSSTLTWDEILALNLKGCLLQAKENGVTCFGPIKDVRLERPEKIIFYLDWIKPRKGAKVFGYKYCVLKNQTPTQTGRIISIVVTGVTPEIPILISLR